MSLHSPVRRRTPAVFAALIGMAVHIGATAQCVADARIAAPTVAQGAAQCVAKPLGMASLATQLAVGDLVFIRIDAKPFREVADATGSWTNHVGIVVDVSGDEPVIAESTFPLSRPTTLARFAARSEGGRLAVRRLDTAPTEAQAAAIGRAAASRYGVFYDTGFDLHSKGRQFCSRFVREVLLEAAGLQVGEVERFGALLERRPDANLQFWRLWYLGRIPWARETVTPASVMDTAGWHYVFDGVLDRP